MHNRLAPLSQIAALIALLALAPGAGFAQADSSGRIAIAGSDGNVHLYDLADGSFTQITTDGTPRTTIYAWPTWATDGQLAYFAVNAGAPPRYTLGIFVKPVDGDAVRVFNDQGDVFTYAYWAPADCPAGSCRDLAVLYTASEGGLAVRRVRSLDGGADFVVDDIARGGPFYWDWSPDGQAMFWTRFNSELSIYDVASDSVLRTFQEIPGFQRAVDWSPVDDRLLTAVVSGMRESSLVILDGDERITLAEELRGIVSFEWSPDGSQVAYTDGDGGSLFVIAPRAGADSVLVSDHVVGFFWSPDGGKIAYITLSREGSDLNVRLIAQSAPVIRWHVYDVASGASQRMTAFLPNREMLYYLQFYDQFARSHRLWSPDSRYIVYGEFLPDGASVVSLLDTANPGAAPEQLMAGAIGIFAWD